MAKLQNAKVLNVGGQRIVRKRSQMPGVREIHVRPKRLVRD